MSLNQGKILKTMVSIFMLIGLFFINPWQVNADSPIKLMLNNQEQSPEVPPIIVNGRVLVPLRFIAESLNAEVRWEENSRTVYLTTKTTGQNPGNNVPVRPNACMITGKVIGYSVQDASLTGKTGSESIYLLDICIESTKDIPGEYNLLKNSTGATIKAYSSTAIPVSAFGKSVSAQISYHGDERGGKYWISNAVFQ